MRTPGFLRSGRGLVASLALLTACSGADHAGRPIIGVVQVSSLPALDDAREGFYKALADSGFVRDVSVTFIERNAQGDIPTLSLIMREFLQRNVTQVATISSVATQTAMKVITDRPIVFGGVSNPYVISAGTSPTAHRPNVTGAAIPPSTISTSRNARRRRSGYRSSRWPAPVHRTSGQASRRFAHKAWAGSCRFRAS